MKKRPDDQAVNTVAETPAEATPAEEIPAVRQLREEIEALRSETANVRRAALEALYPGEHSTLVAHAKREIELAGVLKADADYGGDVGRAVIDLVRVFAGGGHSGGSAMLTLSLFDRVAHFDTLSDLTGHPAEWTEVGKAPDGGRLFQSRRKPSVFWVEGAATWYDIDAKEGNDR